MKSASFTLLLAVVTSSLNAMEPTVSKVEYEHAGKTFESALVAPPDAKDLPAVLMVPNWMGVTEQSLNKAARVAREANVVVYVADVYGKGTRPADAGEAGALAGGLKSNPAELSARTLAAWNHFQSLAKDAGANPEMSAAIGFCFGGSAILELARTGEPLKAFVSFHGGLDSPTLPQSEKIKGSVLVLHGADDPFVPDEEVQKFVDAMRKTPVDWQMVAYGGAVHSFTNPEANRPGKAEYDPLAAKRAFEAMKDLFAEKFAAN